MKQRRRLGDLYVRGKEMSFDDGSGEPVVVWLQKPNEIERDSIIRRANAAKARHHLEGQHEEGELFVSTAGSIREFLDRDGILDIVAAQELFRLRERVEAQFTEDEEGWGKDGRIKGLLEAWIGTDDEPGLAATHAEDENDPEAVRVKGEIEAFNADVDARVEEQRADVYREWDDTPEAELVLMAAREVVKRRGDEVFMREWGRQQIFYSVREPDDHHKRYFGTITEVDDLDDRIRSRLDTALSHLVVTPSEGKDLPATDSSNSSEPPSMVEVSKDSGPEAATA